MYKTKSPILFVAFNRPEITQLTIANLKRFEPSKIYFAVDGPRSNVISDYEKVRKVRDLVSMFDWDCEIHTKFEDKNLGCRLGVSSAISWALSQETAVIILEDDIKAGSDFFQFCDELLVKYQSHHEIGAISGHTFYEDSETVSYSYRFSGVPHIWGWATWKRTWDLYTNDISNWKFLAGVKEIKNYYNCRWMEAVTLGIILSKVSKNKLDSWAYPFVYTNIRNKLLTVTPNVNLTQNIGFGVEATHTTVAPIHLLPVKQIKFPLTHPTSIKRDVNADKWTLENASGLNFLSVLKSLKRIFRKALKSIYENFRRKLL